MKTIATLLGASVLFSLKVLAADPTPLVWRNPNPTSASINAVTFAGGQYVAVAEDDGRGNVLISTNGVAWSFARCPTTSVLRGIAFGAGVYVAVGEGGGVFSSANACTWTARTSGTTGPLYAVAYGDGKFVAVGGQNGTHTFLTSANGTDWSVQTITDGTAYGLKGVAFGNGTWVAVGDPSYDKAPVFVSSNALNWTNRPVTVFPYLGFKAVTYGPAGFTAVGDGSEDRPPILYSLDGSAWTQAGVSNSWYLYLTAVCVANGKLVAAGNTYHPTSSGSYVPAITTSTNGTNWSSPLTLPPAATFSGIAASGTALLAVGSGGTVAASPDGIHWTLQGASNTVALSALTYANGQFLAVGTAGSYGPGVVAQSADGASWNFTQPTNDQLGQPPKYGLTYANGLYVAVGGSDAGSIETSPDGVTWTSRNPQVGAYRGVTYGASGFVAVGANYYGNQAAIAHSADAVNWTNRNSGLVNDTSMKYLNAAAYGGGRYVAVGLSASVVWSQNGVTWTIVTPATSADLYDVLYTNGTFVAVGGQGTILTSGNGSTWTVWPTGFTDTLYGVAYGNGTYVAVGTGGALALSTNAHDWTKVVSGTTANLHNAAYGNGTFVFIGDGGAVLQSHSFRPYLAASMGPGGVAVTLASGEAGFVYRLQSALDLSFSSPTDVRVYSNTGSPLTITDTSTSSTPRKFYRLISP